MGQLISLAQHLLPSTTRADVCAQSKIRGTEAGSVLVEFAASFSFLIFLCLGVISLGGVLNSYLTLVQITDEAVRTLSAVPGLKDNESITWSALTQSQKTDCKINPRGNTSCGHILMQSRVMFLASTMGINSETLDIVSTYRAQIPASAQNPTAINVDAVHVLITSEDLGIITFMGAFPISVEAEGPYLF